MIKEKISMNKIFNFIKEIKNIEDSNFEMDKTRMTDAEGKKIKAIRIYEYREDLLFGYNLFIYYNENGVHFKFVDNDSEELVTIVYESDLIHLESFINYIFKKFIVEVENMFVN